MSSLVYPDRTKNITNDHWTRQILLGDMCGGYGDDVIALKAVKVTTYPLNTIYTRGLGSLAIMVFNFNHFNSTRIVHSRTSIAQILRNSTLPSQRTCRVHLPQIKLPRRPVVVVTRMIVPSTTIYQCTIYIKLEPNSKTGTLQDVGVNLGVSLDPAPASIVLTLFRYTSKKDLLSFGSFSS